MTTPDDLQAEVNRLQTLTRLQQLERFYALEISEGWTQEQAIEHKALRTLLSQPNLANEAGGLPTLKPYQRPGVTQAEGLEIAKLAHKVAGTHNLQFVALKLVELMRENVTLTKECNEHRTARGLEPLPTHHEVK